MALDTSGFSEVGRYGTVYVMKRLQADAPLAAYPLDEEAVTFGRDQFCNVRLYYPQVSPLHCKIIFEDRKAFLVVLGANGVLVDGCKVMPNTTSNASPFSADVTVPLMNNSEIEIHNKRFMFVYPPKEIRAALLATPARGSKTPHRRRSLRMSMIQSAQVFSPRPSHDPRENLRVLKSPLKPFASPVKSSLLRHATISADADNIEDQEIVLVDGNHPRVVEEEKDLIILEDIEVEDSDKTPTKPRSQQVPSRTPGRVAFNVAPSSSSSSSDVNAQGRLLSIPAAPANPPPQPKTPQRRAGRPTLHKAVLIRSAQRVVLRAEEEQEEREVEEFATQLNNSTSSESASESDEDYVSEDEEDEGIVSQAMWAKGLQAVRTKLWPFGSDSNEKGEELSEEQDGDADDQNYPPDETIRDAIPIRSLGGFMTPQASRTGTLTTASARYSMGGPGEARRVPLQPKWRVNDIVVPSQPSMDEETDTSNRGSNSPSLDASGVGRGQGRETLSEQERKAIQERRRSALRTPDPFFAGQTPGLRRQSGFPASPSKTPAAVGSLSPFKTALKQASGFEQVAEDDEEEELDTRSLMERMKETVEAMKRRRSVLPTPGLAEDKEGGRKSLGLGLSPSKRTPPGLASTPGPSTPARTHERRFSLLTPAAREEVFGPEGVVEASAEQEDEDAMEVDVAEDRDAEVFADADADVSPLSDAHPERDGGISRNEKECATSHVLQTPRMDGIRHMFAASKQAQASPAFSGMRQLFKEAEVPQTPMLGGIRDMMTTPEGYGAPEVALPDPMEVNPDEEPAAATTENSFPARKLQTLRVSRKKPRSATSKDTPSVADDEATPGQPSNSGDHPGSDVDDSDEANPHLKTRTARKKVLETLPAAVTAKPVGKQDDERQRQLPARARSRSKPRSHANEPDASDVPPVPAVKPSLRRGAKVTKTETAGEDSTPSETVDAKSTKAAPVRGRKLASKTSDISSKEDQPPPKPLRKGRSARTTASGDDSREDNSVPSTENEEPAGGPKRRVATRSRAAAKETIKAEPADDLSGEADVKPGGKTRGKAPAVTPKSRAAKTPTSRKVSAAVNVMSDSVDKENTPDPIDEDDGAEKLPKAKVSRAKKPSAKKVKEEVMEVAPVKTRVTRARTRT